MYSVALYVTPSAADLMPFTATGRAVYADFFNMFQAPFHAGTPWSTRGEEDKANVVVVRAKLAARFFSSGDAVG
jgi:putative ABC transport system permease protein